MFLNGLLVTSVKLKAKQGFYVAFLLSYYNHEKLDDLDILWRSTDNALFQDS
jgi:hypothetical protein